MPDAGAEVHRAGRQERKTDTKLGREKTSKPTSTTWSPPGWAEILFVSAASDLDNMAFLQKLEPFLTEPNTHTWPRSQRS